MKTKLFILSAVTLFFSACGKKDNPAPAVTADSSYINTTAGSTWNYQQIDSSGATPSTTTYSLTSTSQDSTINGRKYHVYNYSNGGNNYMVQSGNDYYQYDSIPFSGGIRVERLYLKDNLNVGDTWTDNFNFTVPSIPLPIVITATNKIVEKGISRSVSGSNYSNVIHVSTSLSAAGIPSSGFNATINSYYAPKYGLIESGTMLSVNYLTLSESVNIHTNLVGATLK